MIRKVTSADYDAVWDIFSQVIHSGDTYVFRPNTPKKDLAGLWLASNMHTYVYEKNGTILGTYFIKANQIDLGSHIANAGYMVHPNAQGKGIGKQLCEHSLDEARKLGFKAMQFNLVVSTNEGALHLWKKIGFEIVGTIPKAFEHRELGLIDAHVMYMEL